MRSRAGVIHPSAAGVSRLDGTTETGAGPFNLSFGEQTIAMLAGVAGVRLDYAVPTDWGTLTPQLRLEYSHDPADSSAASVGYADLGSLAPLNGLDLLSRDTLTLGVGTDLQFDNGLLLGFDYDLVLGLDKDSSQHRISANLGAEF